MDVASYSTAVKLQEVQSEASVKILKSANDQAEAVIGILLDGVAEVTRMLPDGKGQTLDITA